MRTRNIFCLSLLALFTMTAASEASIQQQLVSEQLACLAQPSVSAVDAELESLAAICWGEMPGLRAEVDSQRVGSDPQRPISVCELAEITGMRRQTLPEPATLAVWSLIGLCWAGVSCWRQRRGASRSELHWNRRPTRHSRVRPPWPEHVRTAVREIIDRGCPR